MKFTHGQKVTCKIKGTEIKDAKISINSHGSPYICQNFHDGSNADDKLGYKYSWVLEKDFTNTSVTDLRPVEKIWDNLFVGDIIVNTLGEEAKILAVLGDVFLRSLWGEHDAVATWYTTSEVKNLGWTIKQDEPMIELTLEDVAKLKGVDVSKIRIKE